MKYKLYKVLNIVKCSRNLEFGKTNWSKLYHTKSSSRKETLHFEEKETVKAISKGVYIWIYFSFCGVVVHFLGGGR